MKRVMVDLFCGRGGWTKGFMAHGWYCIGIDINPQPDYPGEFIQADIAQMLELPLADFYCCSSPCQQFSIHGMRNFHPVPKWPWLGISLFDYARYLLDKTAKPYIMENVRPAEAFVGQSINHCGPFYLWGPGVPAIFPREAYRVKKGIELGSGDLAKKARAAGCLAEWRKRVATWSYRDKDVEAARVAEIPKEISSHIAQMAVNL